MKKLVMKVFGIDDPLVLGALAIFFDVGGEAISIGFS